MKEKKLMENVDINTIYFDKNLYPRTDIFWQVIYDYMQSMKTGIEFPPIILAVYNKKKYLVDGKHRVEAHRKLKLKNIKAEVFFGWSKKKIFEEAVKRNIAHGRVLSPYEKRKIALKLRKWKYPNEDISKIVQIPLDKLNNFIAQRLINTITGDTIVKSGISHLAGTKVKDVPELEYDQQHIKTQSQESLLKQLIFLLENDLIDKNNPKIIKLLEELKNYIISF
jgi:hypothetical protein